MLVNSQNASERIDVIESKKESIVKSLEEKNCQAKTLENRLKSTEDNFQNKIYDV